VSGRQFNPDRRLTKAQFTGHVAIPTVIRPITALTPWVIGQRRDEVDPLGDLVRREHPAELVADCVRVRRARIRIVDHVGGDHLSPAGVRFTEHLGPRDAGDREQRLLHLARIYVIAGVDHIVEAPLNVVVPGLVDSSEITESAPTVGIGVVGDHHGRARAQLADAAGLSGDWPQRHLDGIANGRAATLGEIVIPGEDFCVVFLA
jgi:hypothetical protein